MKKIKWFSLTSSLHVLQFEVDVALDVQRQGCLAPRDHGSVDDTHVAASHSLPGLHQKIQCDSICTYFTHLWKKVKKKITWHLLIFFGYLAFLRYVDEQVF